MRKRHILYTTTVILSLFIINNTSALSYSSDIDLSFTFDPTISISVSDDLIIPNLTPGTTANSNIININIATNVAYGYTLLATVGNESDYPSSNLINSNYSFNNIAEDANLDNLTIDNTWGYSYKKLNDNAWSSYNGLPSYTNTKKQLVDTNYQTEDTINFKIAAKAGNTQPSGMYNNIVNFYAIAKPTPQAITDLEYLQEFDTISTTDLNSIKNSMTQGQNYTLKDQRDEQVYTIAKLDDGKIWMTKNLNLAGGTILSSNDTDFEPSYVLPTTNGWTTTDNNSKLVMPASSTSGFSTNNYASLYNSDSTACASNSPCYSYYSWDTATMGSGRNVSVDNTDASYSICPKGWRLPNTYNGVNNSASFRALIIAYGGSSTVQIYGPHTQPTGTTIYNAIKPNTPPNFILAGNYNSTSFNNVGISGHYWSSTSGSDNSIARSLRIDSSSIYSATGNYRSFGFSVRCLARQIFLRVAVTYFWQYKI